jgi:hypothetical protein
MPTRTTLFKDAIAPADTTANPLGEQVKRDGGGFKKLVDKSVAPPKRLADCILPGNLKSETQAEQYRNPNGWPGLAGLQFNRSGEHPFLDKPGDKKIEKSRHFSRTGRP